MDTFKFFIACYLILVSSLKTANASHLSYQVNTSLIYMDHLKRPNTAGDNIPYIDRIEGNDEETPQNLDDSRAAGSSRSLGLKEFKIYTHLQHSKYSALTATFRPDAALNRNDSSENREFDSRSGVSYWSKPKIQLLDHYAVHFNTSNASKVSLGIFDNISPATQSYSPSLEFGLHAALPHKVHGLHFQVDLLDPDLNMSHEPPQAGTMIHIWLHNGRDDRAERLEFDGDTFDEAPSTTDSYLQLMVATDVIHSDGQQYRFLAGYGDNQYETGHINEIFANFGYRTHLTLLDSIPWRLCFDLRIAKERWHTTGTQYASLFQRSGSLTHLFEIKPRQQILFGMHYGTSDRHLENARNSETLKGWQTDFGYRWHHSSETQLTFMSAMESRLSNIDSQKEGIRHPDDQPFSTSYLMRFAIELTYNLQKY